MFRGISRIILISIVSLTSSLPLAGNTDTGNHLRTESRPRLIFWLDAYLSDFCILSTDINVIIITSQKMVMKVAAFVLP